MGILISLISACFLSSKDLISKRISFDVSGVVSAFASFFFCLPFYLVAMLVLGILGYESFALGEAFIILVIFRSLTDVVAEWSKMEALRHGDISLLSNFLSLAPLFLLFTSPLITGDSLSWTGITAVVLVVLGSLLLLYQPGATAAQFSARGVGLAVTSAFFMSLNNCFDRLAVQTASPLFAGFSMSLLSMLVLVPFVRREVGWRGTLRKNATPFLARGILEMLFMTSKLWALQFLPAPYVSSFTRLALIFSIVGGRVFFHEGQFGRRLLAGILIVAT